jgi:hypothetical protein
MALIKCKECGKEISDEAKVCPHCGKKPGMSMTSAVVIGFLLLLPFVFYTPSSSTSTPKPPPNPAAEARFQKTARMADGVKRMLRDPESVVWESIRSNDDASVICIEYRARNGFGGMAKEFAVYSKNNVSQEAKAWNKYCTKPLNDMIHVEYAIK